MNIDLTGKTAVVTGGGRGIGASIALELARAGADVWIEDELEDIAKETSAQIAAMGRKSGYLVGNVKEEKHTAELIKAAYEDTGSFDIMVNNAGIFRGDDFMDMDTETIQELLDVNLFGVIHGTRNALKKLDELEKPGRIINVASIAGRGNMGGQFAFYCVSKAAVMSFTQAAAQYAGKNGTTVNALCPGIVRTEMWEEILDILVPGDRQELAEERTQAYDGFIADMMLLPRDQKEIDMAWYALYLCSDGGKNVTGQAFNVDGGAVMS